jgi:hypothetical protein
MSVAPLAAVTGVTPAQAAPAAGDITPVAADVAPGSAASAPATPTPSQPSAPAPPADPVLQAVDVARAAAAGRQASLAPLLADLSQAVASPALSGQVRSAIAQVLALQTPVDGPITAQVVKDAVAQSGLFLEAHLARLAPSGAAPPDLKAALLILQRALAAVPASLSPAAPPAAAAAATPTTTPAPPASPASPTTGAAAGAPAGPAPSPGPPSAVAAPPSAGLRPAPPAAAPQTPVQGPFLAALQARPEAGPLSQAAGEITAPALAAPAAPGMTPTAAATPPQAAGDAPAQSLRTPGPTADPPARALSPAPMSPAPAPASLATPQAAPAAARILLQPFAPPVAEAQARTQAPQSSAAALISAQSMEEAPPPALAPPEIEPAVPPGPYDDAALDLRSAMLLLQRAFGAAPAGRTGPASRAAAPPPPLRQSEPGAQAAEPAALPSGDEATIAQHLAGETDQALARLTLHQLASLPEAAGGPAWVFELPLATPQGAAMAQFVIDHDDDAGSAASAEPAWRARFSINVEPLGPVHIHLRVGRESSAVTLWAERDGGVERLRSQGSALADALGADVVIHPGAPRRSTPPPGPGQFVDQSS